MAPRRLIPWQDSLSKEEVQKATLTKTTTPGIDGITTRLLKACWVYIEEQVRQLFQAFIQIGHFPLPFCKAEIVMIQKLGKTDLSSTRSWRPISLLSYLGKGLERLIARCMAYTALQEGVISPLQIGALPGRAAVDLTTCLTHEIERALNKGLTATLVTKDVKAAFDSVLRNRLILKLLQQGWPVNLVRLILAFASNRTALIRLEDIQTDEFPLSCGLSQGSPLTPITFLLYIADILLGNPKRRFGYAEDIALAAIGPTLEVNSAALQEDVTQVLT